MTHTYIIYLVNGNTQTTYTLAGVEAAYNGYVAAKQFAEALLGEDAHVFMVDGETGEILADSDEEC